MSLHAQGNRRILLAARPEGQPRPSDFQLDTQPVPTPAPGQVLLRTLYLSIDPYMRNLMDAVAPATRRRWRWVSPWSVAR